MHGNMNAKKMVVPYRCFGTPLRFRLQGWSSQRGMHPSLTTSSLKMGPISCPKRSCGITTVRCVTSQKSAELIHIAAEPPSRTGTVDRQVALVLWTVQSHLYCGPSSRTGTVEPTQNRTDTRIATPGRRYTATERWRHVDWCWRHI
jgi:hypothetical protein